jgi:hypothetical protein
MPRRALKILKVGWAVLAWVLFISGVIGCGGAPLDAGQPDVGVSNAGTSDAATSDATAPAVFESYLGESFYEYPNPRSHSSVSITASGAVSTDSCHAQASAADLADFIAKVTSPEVLAFFADPRVCGDTVDGEIYGTLTLKGRGPVKKSLGCGDLVNDLLDAAVAAVAPVCARAQADASATDAVSM